MAGLQKIPAYGLMMSVSQSVRPSVVHIMFVLCFWNWSSGGRVNKVLACGVKGPGFDSRLRQNFQWFGYLLRPSRDMAEISLKRHKSSIQPTNSQPKFWNLLYNPAIPSLAVSCFSVVVYCMKGPPGYLVSSWPTVCLFRPFLQCNIQF